MKIILLALLLSGVSLAQAQATLDASSGERPTAEVTIHSEPSGAVVWLTAVEGPPGTSINGFLEPLRTIRYYRTPLTVTIDQGLDYTLWMGLLSRFGFLEKTAWGETINVTSDEVLEFTLTSTDLGDPHLQRNIVPTAYSLSNGESVSEVPLDAPQGRFVQGLFSELNAVESNCEDAVLEQMLTGTQAACARIDRQTANVSSLDEILGPYVQSFGHAPIEVYAAWRETEAFYMRSYLLGEGVLVLILQRTPWSIMTDRRLIVAQYLD